jgi:hypothetical protein
MPMKTIPTDRTVTYQHQYRRCGDPSCHCHRGEKHGPYLYAYWRMDGKIVSAYVGRTEPAPASKAEE